MSSNRIEAFTDGVIAIIITIMVLELSPPESYNLSDVINFLIQIGIYAISFIYVGIYWMNHHHLFQTVKKVNGKILITNLGLLFFLSLVPLATAWISDEFVTISLIFYGLVLIMCSIIYTILVSVIINNDNEITKQIYDHHGKSKEKLSTVIYLAGIIIAIISPIISLLLYLIVAIIWIIPDTRIESMIEDICN